VFKVGLTGGIGCGKTTVSKLFAEFNVPVIDADDIAHHLVKPGQPALLSIRKVFGDKVFNPDDTLNRQQLRDIVFSNPQKKQQLEGILHPLVFNAMQNAIDHLDKPYCILSIPLLFETNKVHFVDRVLVVDCPVEHQIARVKHRDALADTRIQSIIDSQVSREFRLSHADDIINNTERGGRLAEQVKKLHNLYLSISASLGRTRS
jgi:dephospho-CoA kinase